MSSGALASASTSPLHSHALVSSLVVSEKAPNDSPEVKQEKTDPGSDMKQDLRASQNASSAAPQAAPASETTQQAPSAAPLQSYQQASPQPHPSVQQTEASITTVNAMANVPERLLSPTNDAGNTHAEASADGPEDKPSEERERELLSIKRRNQAAQFQVRPDTTICQNCLTTTTPLWRRDETGQIMCNACGLFLKLHGRRRPISLKTDVIKSRNRSNRGNRASGSGPRRTRPLAMPMGVHTEATLRQIGTSAGATTSQTRGPGRPPGRRPESNSPTEPTNPIPGQPMPLQQQSQQQQPQQQQPQSQQPQQVSQPPVPNQQLPPIQSVSPSNQQIPGVQQLPQMHVMHPLGGMPGIAPMHMVYPATPGLQPYINAQGPPLILNSPALQPLGTPQQLPQQHPMSPSMQRAPQQQLGTPQMRPTTDFSMQSLDQPLSPQVIAQAGATAMMPHHLPARGAMSELLLPHSPDFTDRIPHLAQVPVAQFQQSQANAAAASSEATRSPNVPSGPSPSKAATIAPTAVPATPGTAAAAAPENPASKPATPDNKNAQLETRVSELELVNDLLRRRVNDLEAQESAGQAEIKRLRGQLAQQSPASSPHSPPSKRIKVSELV